MTPLKVVFFACAACLHDAARVQVFTHSWEPPIGTNAKKEARETSLCRADSVICTCELLVQETLMLPSNFTKSFSSPTKTTFFINGVGLANYPEAECVETPSLDVQQTCEQCMVEGASTSASRSMGNCLFHEVPAVCLQADPEYFRCYKGGIKYAYIKSGTNLSASSGETEAWCEPWDAHGLMRRRVMCEWQPKEPVGGIKSQRSLDSLCSLAIPNEGLFNKKSNGRYKDTGVVICGYETKLEKCLTRMKSEFMSSPSVAYPMTAGEGRLERCYDGDKKVAYITEGTDASAMKRKELRCEPWKGHNMNRRVLCQWLPKYVIRDTTKWSIACSLGIPNYDPYSSNYRGYIHYKGQNEQIYCGYETKLEKCLFRMKSMFIKGDTIANIHEF